MESSIAKTLSKANKSVLYPLFLATSWAQLRITLRSRHETGYTIITTALMLHGHHTLFMSLLPRLSNERDGCLSMLLCLNLESDLRNDSHVSTLVVLSIDRINSSRAP